VDGVLDKDSRLLRLDGRPAGLAGETVTEAPAVRRLEVKRHPQLQPLSGDHHRALVLARRARRAVEAQGDAGAPAPTSLATTWQDVVKRFASELEPHFQVEERWLFPLLEAAGERTLVELARADHARLREVVRSEPAVSTAREFAARLERHVCFEERELFPRAERLLSTDTLALARGLAEAVRQACIDAALAGYESASLAGLCEEGAWEAAVSAIRMAPLDEATARVLGQVIRR